MPNIILDIINKDFPGHCLGTPWDTQKVREESKANLSGKPICWLATLSLTVAFLPIK